MNKTILNIGEYFKLGKFVIPNYQRGYKWGVQNEEGKDAVSVLLDNLIDAYKKDIPDYFIQGVTVYEENQNSDKTIYLIDGQQRTTTMFLLLKFLSYANLPTIEYTVRKETDLFLTNSYIDNGELKIEHKETELTTDFNLQDIYYFKNAVKIFTKKLQQINKEDFKGFVQQKVKLFYITIAKENATKVFTMLNGQKAVMKADELIKADLLRIASQSIKQEQKDLDTDLTSLLQLIKNKVGQEWEVNSLRSKYAREWDKWLYWWNKKDVKDFFSSGNNPMGLLLEYYYYSTQKDAEKKYSFDNFKELCFSSPQETKLTFKRLRDFQKTFEDWYNKPETHNYIGLILKGGGNKKDALLYFLQKGSINDKEIESYAKWSLVGATHKQITDDIERNDETKEQKAQEAFVKISSKEVYGNSNEIALRQLLRRNVLLDTQLERKFDFSIFGEKSLEHIYPKSLENDEESKLKFQEENKEKLSVHCIGNLVLIKKNENSQFSNKSFDEKKHLYFDMQNAKWSLKLLHSVSVFSQNTWDEKSIENNYDEFTNEFKNYYKLNDTE